MYKRQLLGFANKGRLLPGYDADIVLFDPRATRTISADSLHETADWTPYEGVELHGAPVATISRGELIAERGSWLGVAGRGRFVPR